MREGVDEPMRETFNEAHPFLISVAVAPLLIGGLAASVGPAGPLVLFTSSSLLRPPG